MEPIRIKEETITFYKKLYIGTEEWSPAGNFSNCLTISEAENEALQDKFDE